MPVDIEGVDALGLLKAEVIAFNHSVAAGAPVPLPKVRRNARFQKLYWDRPHSFAYDCINWKPGQGLTKYQYEILETLPVEKRLAVRGPHGLGKTAVAALVILWFGLTRDGEDWKCPTTASAWRQLTKYLWPEIHKWARMLKWDMINRKEFNLREELQMLSLKLDTGEAFAAASDNPSLIEGAHADHILYLFDESKAIPAETFDAAEGAFSGGGSTQAYALAISTPGEPVGRFYDIHKRKPGYEDWHVRHVTLQEAIDAGRISPAWAEQRRKQWGEQSAMYQNRVLGEFCASDEDGVIPLSWIEMANERWKAMQDELENGLERGPLTSVGVDVGSGKAQDKTVFAPKYCNFLLGLFRNDNENTMQTAGRTTALLRSSGAYAVVDVVGIGAGVVERVREQGFTVVGFNAGERSEMKDRSGELGFVNKRSAAWWCLREQLDPTNDPVLALPPDDMLTGDLTAPHWRITSNGRIEVEGKDSTWANETGQSMRQRLGRSTDDGDAVVMACFSERERETYVTVGAGEGAGESNVLQSLFAAPARGNGNGSSNGHH